MVKPGEGNVRRPTYWMCRIGHALPICGTGMNETAAENPEQLAASAGPLDLIAVAHVNSLWLKGEGGHRAHVAGHTFSHIVASQLSFAKARFQGCSLLNCELERGGFEDAEFDHCDLSGTTLTEADFTEAQLCDVDFARVWMPRACFVDTALTRVSLKKANVDDGRFHDTRGIECSFYGARLHNAHFHHACFSESDFSSAELDSA